MLSPAMFITRTRTPYTMQRYALTSSLCRGQSWAFCTLAHVGLQQRTVCVAWCVLTAGSALVTLSEYGDLLLMLAGE